MRFISQYTNFHINIRNPKKRFTDYGVEVEKEEIVAQFDRNGWTQTDLDAALIGFQFKGLFQHEDEVSLVSPVYRLSVYDTDEQAELNHWSPEEKEMVEERLLSAKSLGTSFILVEETPIAPPWPTYDEFTGTPEKLVKQVLDLGYSPEVALAYEESKWGQGRVEVIQALQSAIDARDAGEIVIT